MRVAVASRSIQDWVDELSSWPWPTHDTSAGFARPPAKRRKLFEKSASDNGLDSAETQQHEDKYLGCLLVSDVAAYEKRVHEIGQDVEDLDVEEIKSHILHNHILPLSRPGTPISDNFRLSTMSTSVCSHMDDFTALITATIIQALPNLSRLTRLLDTWKIRLLVLRKSSSFLTALVDAEVALKAGWKAAGPRKHNGVDTAEDQAAHGSVLSGREFEVMKAVVERKVAKAGQSLDFMLDVMEGREDTLPEDWIDRLDTLEQDYAEWASACERQILGSAWTTIALDRAPAAGGATAPSMQPGVAALTLEQRMDGAESQPVISGEQPLSGKGTFDTIPSTEVTSLGTALQSLAFTIRARHVDEISATSNHGSISSPPAIMVHPAAETLIGVGPPESQSASRDQIQPDIPSSERPSGYTSPQTPHDHDNGFAQVDILDGAGSGVDVKGSQRLSGNEVASVATNTADAARIPKPLSNSPGMAIARDLSESVMRRPRSQLFEDDDDFPDSEIGEPDLPTLPRERRGSEASNASTVVHGPHSEFGVGSTDPPDQGTPDFHRFRDVVLPSTEAYDPDLNDDVDVPSSPPNFRSSTRSLSVSFNGIPTVVEAPEEDRDETHPGTPLDVSFSTGDEPDHHDTPSRMSVSGADEQLQQQISEILDSIPAKIRLASEPSAINLNPPDFTMPAARAKARDSLPPRSYSSLSGRSSRAGTPSFTLAPAKNLRPRHQRGNQEIKLYHLSRSNGEPPIKLFIRCVGDKGERVMVRVGGGWADLGEYLREYASHHGNRGGEAKVEVRDLPRIATASPPSRPASAMSVLGSPVTPLNVRKARRSIGSSAGDDLKLARQPLPKTPLTKSATAEHNNATATTPSSSGSSGRSRSSSRLSWTEEDSSLGMAGPKSKHIELSEERKAWVESAKEKVRLASGDQRAAAAAALALANRSPASPAPARAATPDAKLLPEAVGKFGELGKVGSTKRLFMRKKGTGTGGTGNGLALGK
jgi:hypothetical protein